MKCSQNPKKKFYSALSAKKCLYSNSSTLAFMKKWNMEQSLKYEIYCIASKNEMNISEENTPLFGY